MSKSTCGEAGGFNVVSTASSCSSLARVLSAMRRSGRIWPRPVTGMKPREKHRCHLTLPNRFLSLVSYLSQPLQHSRAGYSETIGRSSKVRPGRGSPASGSLFDYRVAGAGLADRRAVAAGVREVAPSRPAATPRRRRASCPHGTGRCAGDRFRWDIYPWTFAPP